MSIASSESSLTMNLNTRTPRMPGRSARARTSARICLIGECNVRQSSRRPRVRRHQRSTRHAHRRSVRPERNSRPPHHRPSPNTVHRRTAATPHLTACLTAHIFLALLSLLSGSKSRHLRSPRGVPRMPFVSPVDRFRGRVAPVVLSLLGEAMSGARREHAAPSRRDTTHGWTESCFSRNK